VQARFVDHQHACAANRHIVWLVVPDRFAPVLRELAPLTERFRVAGHCLYLVGGTVRDLLVESDRADFDLDLTTDARPDQIKACLDGWAESVWNQGEKFGTIGANKLNPETGEQRPYEITTFRAES
jgi:poly(A) polymerase